MHVLQQRDPLDLGSMFLRYSFHSFEKFRSSEDSSSDDSWCKSKFDFNVYSIIRASQSLSNDLRGITLEHAYNLPPELEPDPDNAILIESGTVSQPIKQIKNLAANQTDLIHHDAKTVDADAKFKKNDWTPVQEVKEQFIIRTNPLTNHLISSFDVACILEFNPDGSPVEKMEMRGISSCAVHREYELGCTMGRSQPSSRPMCGNAGNGVYLSCIDNKVNRIPPGKSLKKNKKESLDDSENGENVDKKWINKLIADLSNKKRNKEPLICEICQKRFTAVGTLKSHYYSHGKIKPFLCPLCGDRFTRKYTLKYHMLIHYNKYRYYCNKCSRKFRHTTHFKAHCNDHGSGTPFQCAQCHSSFENRNILNRHIKTKHLN